MPNEDWGVKRVCPVTGKRFFDLNRKPVISPYTGEVVPTDEPGGKFSSQPSAPVKEKKVAKPVKSDDDEDLLVDDDDAVDVDDDLLEDDDDDAVALDDLADVASDDDES